MAFRRSVRIAALFSGGKDSTYAAYVAAQRGWELTHLLSVIPEDRDSMLFHVPNLSMTALLAQAMRLPLLTEAAKAGEAGELDALRRIFHRIDADGVVGGAYETLVLDAPLFHQRLEVLRAESEWKGTAGVWRVLEARLVPKDGIPTVVAPGARSEGPG